MPYIIRQISKNKFQVLNDETGEIHAKNTTMENAKAQLRILMEEHKKKMKGEGLYDIAQSLYDPVNAQPPMLKKLLEEHGTESISDLQVRRMPLGTLINTFLSYLTWGAVKREMDKYAYDQLYHLQLYVKTTEGTEFIIEKNERINILYNIKMNQFTEMQYVSFNKTITINDLINNTQKLMGPRFYPYNAVSNNCQAFVNSILNANEINTPALREFVNQPVQEIFSKTSPVLKKVVEYIIHLGYIKDVVIQGGELVETLKS